MGARSKAELILTKLGRGSSKLYNVHITACWLCMAATLMISAMYQNFTGSPLVDI